MNVVRPRTSRSSASCTSASLSASKDARGLVEDGGVLEEGARDGEALALAAGEAGRALADGRVVAWGSFSMDPWAHAALAASTTSASEASGRP